MVLSLNFSRRCILLPAFILFTALKASHSGTLSPMHGYSSLVAGESSTGHDDGPFILATFNKPKGLALDPQGDELYVADTGNDCIRIIDLKNNNQVSTLTGTSYLTGSQDGDFVHASFNSPENLAFISDTQLAIADNGNHKIRLVDLSKKIVTTLAGNGASDLQTGNATTCALGYIWNMVFLKSENALYFSEPDFHSVLKLDIATGALTIILQNNSKLPNPAALCVWQDQLYVADQNLPQVYKMTLDLKSGLKLTQVGQGAKILSLFSSGQTLYALQNDTTTPLKRLAPTDSPIHFLSAWGDTLPVTNTIPPCVDISNCPSNLQVVADPMVERSFYIPNPTYQSIFSFQDLFPEDYINADLSGPNPNGLVDLDYSSPKAPGIFRILILGDSHVFHTFGPDYEKRGFAHFNLMESLSKQLEFTLNIQATLAGAPVHYEVLTQAHIASDQPLFLWPYYETPAMVKKFDIDLVLFCFAPNTVAEFSYPVYFQRPITPEGIPTMIQDPEYRLKSVDQRIPTGLPGDFFRLCQSKHLADTNDDNVNFADYNQLLADPDIEKYLVRLFDKPIALLRDQLKQIKTAQGNPVSLAIDVMPMGLFYPMKLQRPFWLDLQKQLQVPLLDMTEDFTALRPTFFPFSERSGRDHLSADGYTLAATVLAHQLIQQGLIPLAGTNIKSSSN